MVEKSTTADWILATSALLLIFVGTYKGMVASPVDLTLVMLGIMALALVPHRRSLLEVDVATGFLLAATVAWAALRLLPEPSAWGLRKTVEMVAIGIPVVAAGVAIGARPAAQRALMLILSWLAAPLTAYLAFNATALDFSTIGSGSYQHAGILMALSAVASAASGRYILLAVAAFGCVLTGHISGVLFGALAAGMVLVTRRAWLEAGKAACLFVLFVGTFSAFVAVPVVVSRVAVKFDRTLAFAEKDAVAVVAVPTVTAAPVVPAPSIAAPTSAYMSDAGEVAGAKFDRIELYAEAVKRIMEEPTFGWGFGKADYVYTGYPHNFILELGAETGIFGLMLGAALLFAAARSSVRTRNAFAMGILLLVGATAMVSGYFGGRYLMFAFGLAAGGSPFSLLAWARKAHATRRATDPIGTP